MDFNCYIDESGDEGMSKAGATRWFILGALIVPRHLNLQTSTMVNRIKGTFGKDNKWTLHWSHVRNHDKRLYICRELLTEQWEYSSVVSDKYDPVIRNAEGLRQKWKLYFYSTRLLLERLSWYTRDVGQDGKAYLTFENRSNMSYDDLREYLDLLSNWYPPTAISWDNLEWENFEVKPKSKSRLLQASDSVSGALSDGLEHTTLGNIEPRYILDLKGRFYRHSGRLFSYGLKFTHIPPWERLRALRREYEWLKQMLRASPRTKDPTALRPLPPCGDHRDTLRRLAQVHYSRTS